MAESDWGREIDWSDIGVCFEGWLDFLNGTALRLWPAFHTVLSYLALYRKNPLARVPPEQQQEEVKFFYKTPEGREDQRGGLRRS